jgi:hypothetical protein
MRSQYALISSNYYNPSVPIASMDPLTVSDYNLRMQLNALYAEDVLYEITSKAHSQLGCFVLHVYIDAAEQQQQQQQQQERRIHTTLCSHQIEG